MSKRLEAVVEIYGIENFNAWDTEKNSEKFLRLWENTTLNEAGSIIAQIARYNGIEINNKKETIINSFLNEESLVVGGGLKFVDGEKKINPGCCCGLESWDECLQITPERCGLWLGHNPAPYIEFLEEERIYRIWSDVKANGRPESIFYIDFKIDEFNEAVKNVSQDLRDFLIVLKHWADKIAPNQSDKLVETFKTHFYIE